MERPDYKKSRRQERRGAARMGGSTTPGSGAFWSRKGDARTKKELIEYKRTDKKSFTIKTDVLEKIYHEAITEGRLPLLGFQLNSRNYIIMTEDDYLEMRGLDGLDV